MIVLGILGNVWIKQLNIIHVPIHKPPSSLEPTLLSHIMYPFTLQRTSFNDNYNKICVLSELGLQMIATLLDILRRNTGLPSTDSSTDVHGLVDESTWKSEFDTLVAKSEFKPRLLVEFARRGFPSFLRGWAWSRVLRINEVPCTNLPLKCSLIADDSLYEGL